jgi:antitoxin component of MazEF toxin-antitoxin module
MKFQRRLAKHGSSQHVSIPPQVIDFLRWRSGDGLILEVRDRRELIIHLPFTTDDLRAPAHAMTIDATLPEVV